MFPKILKSFELKEDTKTFKLHLIENLENGKSLYLVNEIDLQEDRFLLRKQRNLFNPFEQKFLFAEIAGIISENLVRYEIRIRLLMKVALLFNIVILSLVAIVILFSGDIIMGLIIPVFLLMAIYVAYWNLRNESKLLEKEATQIFSVYTVKH